MGMEELFQNKLFLQYLAAGGQDLVSGQPFGTNVNAVTQQNISSQNYMKLLSKMLAGHVPKDGKVTMDADGTTIKVPQSALESLKIGNVNPFGAGGFAAPNPGQANLSPSGGGVIPQIPQIQSASSPAPQNGGPFNPFAFDQLGNISGADLAGLTPQDISQALNIRLGQDELTLRKISEMNQQTYQQGLMRHYGQQGRASELNAQSEAFRAHTSRLTEERQWEELMRLSPLTVPGMKEQLTLKEWEALTPDMKNYAYYVNQVGADKALSVNDWKNQSQDPAIKKIHDLGLKDKDFAKWYLKQKEAGSPKISVGERIKEKVDTEIALAGVQGEIYFKDPKWTDDLNKHLNSSDVRTKILFAMADKPGSEGIERIRESIRFIEGKVVAGGGEVVKVEKTKDGKSIMWQVKWPSGKTEIIKHAISS